MKSLTTLYQLQKYDAILEATANSSNPSELLIRLNTLEALELYDEWIKETQRLLNFLLPHIEIILEKHLYFLSQQKVTRTSSIGLKMLYDTLPYINQVVEDLLKDFHQAMIQEEKPILSSPPTEAILLSWFQQKKYHAILDFLSQDKANEPHYIAFFKLQLALPLPRMIQTYLLLFFQRIQLAEDVQFERDGLIFQVVPKDLFLLNQHPFMTLMYKKFQMVKDPSLGMIAQQLFEKWIAMTYPFFLTEDPDWVLPAFLFLAHRYLKLSTIPPSLNTWLTQPIHSVFTEEIQQLIESPEEQIG